MKHFYYFVSRILCLLSVQSLLLTQPFSHQKELFEIRTVLFFFFFFFFAKEKKKYFYVLKCAGFSTCILVAVKR